MEKDRLRHGRTAMWTALALLLVLVILLFAPILRCPLCLIEEAVEQSASSTPNAPSHFFGRGCDCCWKGRLSVYSRWLDPHSPLQGAVFTAP